MSSQWLSSYQFHLRRLLRAQPGVFSAILLSGFVLVLALAMYIQQWHSADAAKQEWRSLNEHFREKGHPGNQGSEGQPVLKAFNNTQLVDVLNRVAEEAKLSLDEVSFVLDENDNQPYLRYHATLTVSAAYPAIRRFLDQVRAVQPDVSLDTITCTRDDIATVDLTCDLVLSAFYRKTGHG
jgi:Tfp pilus assembly protein PilO